MYKLSISNLSWDEDSDELFSYITKKGFSAIELAPSKISEPPYSPEFFNKYANNLNKKYGLKISSIQSIWHKLKENLFGEESERLVLLERSRQIIDIAVAMNCKNIVFGCPKNRNIENFDNYEKGLSTFIQIADYAQKNDVVIAVEPNPSIYNTNFLNTTKQTIDFVKKINHKAVKVNLDIGTIIENKENLAYLKKNLQYVNHIHISEPYLNQIRKRNIHKRIRNILLQAKYQNCISIEAKQYSQVASLEETINYISKTFLGERFKEVPKCEQFEIAPKTKDYCLIVPVINEGQRIKDELERYYRSALFKLVDIIICDGDSTDNSVNIKELTRYKVNAILVKKDKGKQGAQIRMGFAFALNRGYKGIITIDGNNKDSIEDVPKFIEKLEEGYDFIQGSRFVKNGLAINTPIIRLLAVKLIHAPIISITAHKRYTDTTNNFRAYSSYYLEHPLTAPLRDVFGGYELLAYLSVRANQLKLKSCEIPVSRVYPKKDVIPTKINSIEAYFNLMKILIINMFGGYKPYD